MNNNEQTNRDPRVILAGLVLALQIIGLLWLLLFARDRLAAFSGEAPTTDVVAQATVAATEEATEAPAVDTAATTEAEAALTSATATAEAAAAETAAMADAALLPEEVAVDTTALEAAGLADADQLPTWVATLVPGAAADAAAGRPALPPHLLLNFVDPQNPDAEPAAPDMIDLNQPQVRVIPIATLLSLLEQSGDAAGQEALDDLLSLLEQQPDPAEAGVPVPPVLGQAVQNFVAQTDYRAFGGGQGIGYVTHISGQNVVPVTNESGLNYVYQGVTADGEQYVFLSWPLDADFLPETVDDAADQVEMLASNPAGYYTDLQEQVNTNDGAAGLRPSLRMLTALVGALSLRGQVAEVDESALVQVSTEDATGITWNWTGSAAADGAETAVETPQNYQLVLWPDGTYSLRADCNVGGGVYTVDADGTIELQPGALSRAFCPEGSRDTEFVQSLLAARAVAFNESGDMVLTLEDGGTMTLANAGAAETEAVAEAEEQPAADGAGLAGLTLQWPGYTNAAGETVTVDNPENYLITLLPDGTFNVVADCNVGGGSYTYSADGVLTLGPIRTTLMACPEGSQGSAFLAFLESVSGVVVADDGAITMTAADGGSTTFVNLPEAEAPAGEVAEQPAGEPGNILWQWTGAVPTDGTAITVANPELYTLALLDDGSYVFRADCNSGTGQYTLDGTTLTLLPGIMTLVACDADSLSDLYLGFLGQVASFGLGEDGVLVLTLADGSTLAFANGGPFVAESGTGGETETADALAGRGWQWTHFRDAKQDYDVTGTYTITFNADGTASVVADCNQGNGTYRIDDTNLTISILATTRVACPAGSLGDSFIEYLNQAGTFAFSDTTLNVILMADGGTMTFVEIP
ncbi:protein of unknown function [Candidatus Promineifilum breve]|uniref:DUF306 domain-containing protein n=1 Tax=Candidatus Promineifilum breve TaxID=1806508 RepID=A0A160T4W5_9CHLR|nr:META domain-containing protein [Candidatus Promineifilum breve]CUS04479.2 protein of unknown function [Candidatus Promineifilum breve]